FGGLTQGFAEPSVNKMLEEKFHMEVIAWNVGARRGGQQQEFDALATSNGDHSEVIVVECKSRLTEEELEKFDQKLATFFKFMPQHKGAAVRGLVVGVELPPRMAERV